MKPHLGHSISSESTHFKYHSKDCSLQRTSAACDYSILCDRYLFSHYKKFTIRIVVCLSPEKPGKMKHHRSHSMNCFNLRFSELCLRKERKKKIKGHLGKRRWNKSLVCLLRCQSVPFFPFAYCNKTRVHILTSSWIQTLYGISLLYSPWPQRKANTLQNQPPKLQVSPRN